MKHKAPQFALPLYQNGEEPFTLTPETTADGQRLTREQTEAEEARRASAARMGKLWADDFSTWKPT